MNSKTAKYQHKNGLWMNKKIKMLDLHDATNEWKFNLYEQTINEENVGLLVCLFVHINRNFCLS